MIDDRLTGDTHIAQLRPKLAGAVAGISRVRKLLEPNTCLLLYHAFFSSKMAYGLEFFGLNYMNRIKPILVLQKRALKCIFHVPPHETTTPIFIACDILPFPLYIDYIFCILIYKILQGFCPNVCGIQKSVGITRGAGTNLLILSHCTSNTGRNTFTVRGSLIWNNLPANIRTLGSSFSHFKKVLKKYLFNRLSP